MFKRDRPTLPPRNRPAPGTGLLGRLTAQQTSLVKAHASADTRFLNRSYYVEYGSRRRTAFELGANDLSRFAAAWTVEPVACIRFLNEAVASLERDGLVDVVDGQVRFARR